MPMLKRGYGAVRNLRGKSGARFPPSTVPENGSSPKTRDASRSITKTQTAVVNSATSLSPRKSLVSALTETDNT